MTPPSPDWIRLKRALAVEAKEGFNDLAGRQYRFSEFLCLELGQPELAQRDRGRVKELADQYARYPNLSFAQRRHLVAQTRDLIHNLQVAAEQTNQGGTQSVPTSPSTERDRDDRPNQRSEREQISSSQRLSKPKLPKTVPLDNTKARGVPNHQVEVELDQPLTQLKGIGPKQAANLSQLNLHTVRDVLYYYPRDHIDYARQVNIRDLQEGQTVTLIGTIRRCKCFTSPRNSKLAILELEVEDHTGRIRLSRFYAGARYTQRGWQEYQKRLYPIGAVIAASGLVKEKRYRKSLDDPQLEILDHPGGTIESIEIGRVVPIYALTREVSAGLIRKAVLAALPAVEKLEDPLPKDLRQKYELSDLQTAIGHIHFPPEASALDLARRRLVFDEFFYLQLGLLRRRQTQRQTQTNIVLAPTGALIDQFYTLLPFQFTPAQQRVVNEILQDLQKPVPMNRLVQGDVGSGKTVVAVVAILAAIQAGYQTALMAPTEVLAEQHYRKLVTWFNQLHLPVELLTGSTKVAKRREILTQLETGQLPLLVGTHALIEDPVKFQQLGLVVIDEQHRFGVQQRARLQQKGDNPHVLTMTATPIPRTLALTMHGDLDVSQIDELPPGRQAIQTTVLGSRDRQHAYDLIRRQVAQGRQVYVVLPLVDESESLDLKSAIAEHQRLQDVVFPDFQVGLLHGRMTSVDKDRAITEFRQGQTQVLVSTTVVEVGVDVPNATVMLIEHAERFGLSQLHQLRGRVGRGAAQSFCLLMSHSRSEEAMLRLKALEQSQDGFVIAEMDLRFRGPGEVLGTRQSGLPDFALASLVDDQMVLEQARQAAERVLELDPNLDRWPALQAELTYRYQRLMGGAILT